MKIGSPSRVHSVYESPVYVITPLFTGYMFKVTRIILANLEFFCGFSGQYLVVSIDNVPIWPF